MKLTKTCLATVNNVLNSKRFSNPEYRNRAFKAIRQIINQTYTVARAESVKWMFKVMISKRIVLNPVRAMCDKLYHGSRMDECRKTLYMSVMKMKAEDSKIQVRREKKKLTEVWKNNMYTLNEHHLKTQIHSIAKAELKTMSNTYKKQKRQKISFLMDKHNNMNDKTQTKTKNTPPTTDKQIPQGEPRSHNIDKILESVVTSDQTLPPDFSSEPRVYGNVHISEEEKSALRLPPKYTLYDKINTHKCMVEIETMVSKYMWE